MASEKTNNITPMCIPSHVPFGLSLLLLTFSYKLMGCLVSYVWFEVKQSRCFGSFLIRFFLFRCSSYVEGGIYKTSSSSSSVFNFDSSQSLIGSSFLSAWILRSPWFRWNINAFRSWNNDWSGHCCFSYNSTRCSSYSYVFIGMGLPRCKLHEWKNLSQVGG